MGTIAWRKNITFHKISKNSEKRKLWLEKMGLQNSHVSENACFCSLHFEEKDLDKTSPIYVKLRPNAVLFGNLSATCEELPIKQNKMDNNSDKHKNRNIIEWNIVNENDQQQSKIVNRHLKDQEEYYDSLTERINNPKTILQCSTPYSSNFVNRGINVSPFLSENSPRKQTLRKALINVKKEFSKKIGILQQKQRRTSKCVARLKDILVSLKKKNLLDIHQLKVLKDIGNCNKHLLRRQLI